MTATRRWADRAAIILFAAAYAGLVIGNGLDRLVLERPALAGGVPGLFAEHALATAARAALRRDPAGAGVLAARLVARAPIDPQSTALLGDARLATGDGAGADRAFRIAGALGWRVPEVQAYLCQQALQQGDYRVAALRFDALLRQRPEVLRVPGVLSPFRDDGAAEAAFIDRLAARPPWLGWFTGAIDPMPDAELARRVPTLLQLRRRKVVLGCALVAGPAKQLRAAGNSRAADALLAAHCPAG